MVTDKAPDLHLDWEERLFGWVHKRWRGWRAPVDAIAPGTVFLGDHHLHLRLVASLFAERPVVLRPSEGHGGVRGTVLLFPPTFAVAESVEVNRAILQLRAAIDGTRIVHGLTASASMVEVFRQASTAARILIRDFPRFEREIERLGAVVVAHRPYLADASPFEERMETLVRSFLAAPATFDLDTATLEEDLHALSRDGACHPPCPLWGSVLSLQDVRAADLAAAEAALDAEEAPSEAHTLVEAPPKDEVDRAFLDEDEDQDIMPMHTFEKVETLDAFNKMMRRTDGSDELEDHLDALNELDLRQIVRGGDRAESIFRADLDGLSLIPDVDTAPKGEHGIAYDEWSERKAAYLPGWVTVYPSLACAEDPGWADARRAELSTLREQTLRRLLREREARRARPRQQDGAVVDIDAWVEFDAERRAETGARGGIPRVYIDRPRQRREAATTVLVDISLSSDAYVEEKRVLDVTQDAVLVLGDVCEALDEPLEVLAFASNTRHHCRVWRVKGFDDGWATGSARLGALSPTGYTRIGPALRHASHGLRTRRVAQKLLLLITDGKPNDYDRYEGTHGVHDVRQAVREAAQDGIVVRALGIDPASAHLLPVMFGPGGSRLLRHMRELPAALAETYARVTCR